MAFITAVTMLISLGVDARAQSPETYYLSLPAEDRRYIQIMLILTGDYAGMVDGDIGPASLAAIRAFQSRNGFAADGILTNTALDRLEDQGLAEMDRLDFVVTRDPFTGADFGLPRTLLRYDGVDDLASYYASPDGRILLSLMRERTIVLGNLYEVIVSDPSLLINYHAFHAPWFVISGRDPAANLHFYIRFESFGSEIRGFWLTYDAALANQMAPVAVLMSNAFNPFPVGPPPEVPPPRNSRAPQVANNPAPTPSTPAQPMVSHGTGFIVGADGTVLTNAHVVEGCTIVSVGEFETTRIVRDEQNDLALLRPQNGTWPGEPLQLAPATVRLGEDVLAFGYPLAGLLADSLNVTQGIVSSMAGPGNDSRYIQITAAVQPGNSGGPLLNSAGQVIGVVSATLNAITVVAATGAIPDGVAFAIRRETMLSFLSSQGIVMPTAPPGKGVSIPNIADRVAASVISISCRPN